MSPSSFLPRAKHLATALLTVLLVVACGGGVEGKYTYTSTVDGEKGSMSLELKSGNKAVWSMESEGISMNEKAEGTYSVDGDKITVTIQGDSSVFTLKGDTLKGEFMGETLPLERE
jgi:hypothetical protein